MLVCSLLWCCSQLKIKVSNLVVVTKTGALIAGRAVSNHSFVAGIIARNFISGFPLFKIPCSRFKLFIAS